MIIMILVVNFFFWRPLVAYVDKFRVEQSESGLKAKSLVLDALRRSSWPALIGQGKRALAEPVNAVHGKGHRHRRSEPDQPRIPTPGG